MTYFNPHSPCGERLNPMALLLTWINFNPHSPCGERLNRCLSNMELFEISIHTPLAGSDGAGIPSAGRPFDISIHTPLAGSDIASVSVAQCHVSHFNPHSPCGERLHPLRAVRPFQGISIHTPLAGSDRTPDVIHRQSIFQSTLPLRGATASFTGNLRPLIFQSTLPLRGATAEMRHF